MFDVTLLDNVDLTVYESIRNERRKIPGLEGYYSLTGEGVVWGDEREVLSSRGGSRTVKSRKMKVYQARPRAGVVSESAYCVLLSIDGYTSSVSLLSLYKATFPEVFKGVVDLDGEEWKTTVGCPKTAVSNLGRVKRYTVVRSNKLIEYTDKECLLTVSNHGEKLMFVNLGGLSVSRSRALVGRLVWETFKGKIGKGLKIGYLDGDYRNVRLSNLYLKRS